MKCVDLAAPIVVRQCTINLMRDGNIYCGQANFVREHLYVCIVVRQCTMGCVRQHLLWSGRILLGSSCFCSGSALRMCKVRYQINGTLHYEFCEVTPIVVRQCTINLVRQHLLRSGKLCEGAPTCTTCIVVRQCTLGFVRQHLLQSGRIL